MAVGPTPACCETASGMDQHGVATAVDRAGCFSGAGVLPVMQRPSDGVLFVLLGQEERSRDGVPVLSGFGGRREGNEVTASETASRELSEESAGVLTMSAAQLASGDHLLEIRVAHRAPPPTAAGSPPRAPVPATAPLTSAPVYTSFARRQHRHHIWCRWKTFAADATPCMCTEAHHTVTYVRVFPWDADVGERYRVRRRELVARVAVSAELADVCEQMGAINRDRVKPLAPLPMLNTIIQAVTRRSARVTGLRDVSYADGTVRVQVTSRGLIHSHHTGTLLTIGDVSPRDADVYRRYVDCLTRRDPLRPCDIRSRLEKVDVRQVRLADLAAWLRGDAPPSLRGVHITRHTAHCVEHLLSTVK